VLSYANSNQRVVITGIGLIASVGDHREAVWSAVQAGRSGAGWLRGIDYIPNGALIAATVEVPHEPGGLKVFPLVHRAAAEAIDDARLNEDDREVDRERFGCAISAHMGNVDWLADRTGKVPWHTQWLPNTACVDVAVRHRLGGPRLCHSTACASGLIEVMTARRAILDGQCDLALAGSGEAIHPLFAAGFQRMRVLAQHEDPQQASRPFDADRTGFVLGEGAGMFVLERLSHALSRGARIYAEIVGCHALAEANHVTDLNVESPSLAEVIRQTLRRSRLRPADVAYINAHGTGTLQNDVTETRGIHRAFGRAARDVCVSSTKSMLGHLVNAAGSVELGLTALALRDGFTPPTINLTRQDPQCDLDCIPLVGRRKRFDHALKLSVAFGGHVAAVALRRWNDVRTGFDYPVVLKAA